MCGSLADWETDIATQRRHFYCIKLEVPAGWRSENCTDCSTARDRECCCSVGWRQADCLWCYAGALQLPPCVLIADAECRSRGLPCTSAQAQLAAMQYTDPAICWLHDPLN